MDDDDLLVRTTGRLVLKRTELTAEDPLEDRHDHRREEREDESDDSGLRRTPSPSRRRSRPHPRSRSSRVAQVEPSVAHPGPKHMGRVQRHVITPKPLVLGRVSFAGRRTELRRAILSNPRLPRGQCGATALKSHSESGFKGSERWP